MAPTPNKINIVIKSNNVHTTYTTSEDLPYAALEGQFAFVKNTQTPVFFSGGIWYDFCCDNTQVKDRNMPMYIVGMYDELPSDLLLVEYESDHGFR